MRILPPLLLFTLHACLTIAISLQDFQPINGFSPACSKAYNTDLADCNKNDFGEGNSCSVGCIAFLEALTDILNQQCKGTSALPSTLMGLFFIEKGTASLCPNVLGENTGKNGEPIRVGEDEANGRKQKTRGVKTEVVTSVAFVTASSSQGGDYAGGGGGQQKATDAAYMASTTEAPQSSEIKSEEEPASETSASQEEDRQAYTSTSSTFKHRSSTRAHTTSTRSSPSRTSKPEQTTTTKKTSTKPATITETSTTGRPGGEENNEEPSSSKTKTSKAKSSSTNTEAPANTGGRNNGGGGTVLDIGSSAPPNARARVVAVLVVGLWSILLMVR